MDRARSLLLARAGRIVDEALSPAGAGARRSPSRPRRGLRTDRSALQDIARLRGFLASPAVHALFDAPWLPIYLLVIFALHPALGAAAAVSALALFALGMVTERFIRARHRARGGQRPRSRPAHRSADPQRRSAGRHGHARPTRSRGWRRSASRGATTRRSASATPARRWRRSAARCASWCRWRCSASAPGWSWPATRRPASWSRPRC